MIKKAIKPTIDVNHPVDFDFIHPAKEITKHKATIPKRKANPPNILASSKSLFSKAIGYPFVVIIKMSVQQNRQTRKLPAATVADFNV